MKPTSSDQLNADRQAAMMILAGRYPDKDERELGRILDRIVNSKKK